MRPLYLGIFTTVIVVGVVSAIAYNMVPKVKPEKPKPEPGKPGEESPGQKAFRELSAANMEKGKKFLVVNAQKKGVITLPSGVQYMVLKEGAGRKPDPTDIVDVHYQGTLIDGTVFDSSIERGKPATFPLNRVIRGWTEAVQHMKEGAKWRVFIPPNLGYGATGAGGKIGPNEVLIFEIELLHVH